MIWKKTALGLVESKTRSTPIDPAARNLLLIIDGAKSQAMLLANVFGINAGHFRTLQALGLIEPSDGAANAAAPAPLSPLPSPVPLPAVLPEEPSLAATLDSLISTHLGLAGLGPAELVRRARTSVELKAITENVLELIRQRKGNAVAEEAAWRLFGRS